MNLFTENRSTQGAVNAIRADDKICFQSFTILKYHFAFFAVAAGHSR
jgi:hypothetical protein